MIYARKHILTVEKVAERSEVSSTEPLMGFMVLYENPSRKSFAEAILVTDKNGYPVEYRFTEKVRVDEPKRWLYGQTLRPYLVLEVFGLRLLKKLDKQPTVIFVRDEEFLELREKTECPILFVKSDTRVSIEAALETHHSYPEDVEKVRNIIESYMKRIPLNEPFERMIQVLREVE